VDENQNLPKETLQARISLLTNRLESEVMLLRTQHGEILQGLTFESNRLLEHLCVAFNNGLKEVQAQYMESLVEMQKEVNYLKELSDSQQIMMKSKVAYIKELEARCEKIKREGSL
jgi:hypothetical protein